MRQEGRRHQADPGQCGTPAAALTLWSAVTHSAEVNRFRLAYALEQECVAVQAP
jgi:hypothetical protein